MKSKPLVVLVVAAGLLMVSGPMFAHHSDAAYDLKRLITLTGTVTKFQFINPHVQLFFDVKDDQDNVEPWVSIFGTPNNLRRRGWNRNTIEPGDQFTISGHPFKNGSNRMNARTIVLNGKELLGRER